MGDKERISELVGRGINPPSFDDDDDGGYDPQKVKSDLLSSGQVGDYQDMAVVHAQLDAARLNLYRVVQEQSQADKESAVAEQVYKRKWNRSYLSSSGTDKIRSTMADIASEDLQNDYIRLQVKSRGLVRKAQFLRDEIRALESLSNDYRQLIRSTS